MTVAVVGAGLAGLSAAWALSRAGADVVVLDAGRQPGGMIVTDRHDGFIVEGGPDGFLSAEPDIQDWRASSASRVDWWIRSRGDRRSGPGGGWNRSPKGRPLSCWGFRSTGT